MLNFSKISVFLIYSFFLLICFFTFLNFQKDDNFIIDKKINLGLDLQGGSYLLLEIDTKPLIAERIQNKVIPLKKMLKENGLSYSNFSVTEDKILFKTDNGNLKKFDLLFSQRKDNTLNFYVEKYKSFELDYKYENNFIEFFFSKYGILTINI